VAPAEQWGFSGGHAFGYYRDGGNVRNGPNSGPRHRRGPKLPLGALNLARIKLPIPRPGGAQNRQHSHHSQQLSQYKLRGGKGGGHHYRKSFDAGFIPEHAMELGATQDFAGLPPLPPSPRGSSDFADEATAVEAAAAAAAAVGVAGRGLHSPGFSST